MNLPMPAIHIDLHLHKSQVRKLTDENVELKSSIQQFWLERKTYDGKIRSLNENIGKLNEELKKFKPSNNPEKVSAVEVINEEKYKK